MLVLVECSGSGRERPRRASRNADGARRVWRRRVPAAAWHLGARAKIVDVGAWVTARSFPRQSWLRDLVARE